MGRKRTAIALKSQNKCGVDTFQNFFICAISNSRIYGEEKTAKKFSEIYPQGKDPD